MRIDEQLIDRMRSVRAVVLPSLSEGFGIPALESMATGTPVLGSRGSVTGELCGELAVLVDPYAREDIELGFRRLLGDPALAEAALKRGPGLARKYLPDRTAAGWTRVLAELEEESCA